MFNDATDQDRMDAFLSRNEEPSEHLDRCETCGASLCTFDHPSFCDPAPALHADGHAFCADCAPGALAVIAEDAVRELAAGMGAIQGHDNEREAA